MADKRKITSRGRERRIFVAGDKAARIEQVLVDAELLLKLVITVHDRAGIFCSDDGQPLLRVERRSHRHTYCLAQRGRRRRWNHNCVDHCMRFVNGQLSSHQQPFIHYCWKGASEAAVPIIRDRVHVATFFAGVFRSPGKDPPGNLKLPSSIVKMRTELPQPSLTHMDSTSRVVEAVGQGLLALLERDRHIEREESDRETEIRRFFHYRAHQPVTLKDLAETLHLSESRTSHLVTEVFGKSFKDMLIEERLRRAKSLLTGSALKIGVVAERIGMQNEYYFNRLFKQRVGVPPGRYRAKNQSSIPRIREG